MRVPVVSSGERVSSSSRETDAIDGSASPRKPERRDREQVFDVAQFAGGVALEGQQGVVAQHAAAVVDDADQAASAGFDLDAQLGRPGVERILEQFFDDRSRPLHHLARRRFCWRPGREGCGCGPWARRFTIARRVDGAWLRKISLQIVCPEAMRERRIPRDPPDPHQLRQRLLHRHHSFRLPTEICDRN